jgi:hypothetical protein
MVDWLSSLTDPLYGIVDLFLDSPVAASVTAALGVLVAAMVLSLR